MATRKVTVTGKAFWAKVFEQNRDMKGFEDAYVECEGAYTINITVEKSEIDKLKAAKSAKKPSIKDDGSIQMKFVRKHKDRFEWSSGAPAVTYQGKPWDYEKMGMIPNESIVNLNLSVYDTSFRPGTRLESIDVLALPDEDGEAHSEPQVNF